jgi:hypothetical protein
MNQFAAQVVQVALLISLSSSAFAAECKFASDRAANFTGEIKKVVISASSGYLKVRGDAAGGVKAKGRACASSEALLRKIALESRREADAIYITVVMSAGMGDLLSFNRYSSLDLDITVPTNAQLEVNDSNGDVELSDVGSAVIVDGDGDLLLKNIAGDLDVTDGARELRVMSVGGNVQVDDGAGGIDIEDVRGNVKITADSSGDISIAKVGGNVQVVNDSSGDITVREVKFNVTIENDTAGDIDVSDVGGKFSVWADSSGNILYQRVSGGVRIPAKAGS